MGAVRWWCIGAVLFLTACSEVVLRERGRNTGGSGDTGGADSAQDDALDGGWTSDIGVSINCQTDFVLPPQRTLSCALAHCLTEAQAAFGQDFPRSWGGPCAEEINCFLECPCGDPNSCRFLCGANFDAPYCQPPRYAFYSCVERNCATGFPCVEGYLIDREQVCDGRRDCTLSNDDERNCNGAFACGDGTSVSADAVCNGRNDCANGMDEAGCP